MRKTESNAEKACMYFNCPDGDTNPIATDLLYNKDTAVTTHYELSLWLLPLEAQGTVKRFVSLQILNPKTVGLLGRGISPS
jgi:hypothetical protein